MTENEVKEKRIRFCNYMQNLAMSKGITQEQIAEDTGFIRTNINRVLSGKHSPTLDVLIKIADAVGYDIALTNKDMINAKIDGVKPKFLMSVDKENKQLYILHRNYPSCLIWIKQETPARFIILDLYDDVDNPADILNMPFVEEAKEFYRNHVIDSMDKN